MENTESSNNLVVKKTHKLIIDGRKNFSIFGILEVLETTADFLSVRLASEILNIKGKNISIKKLAVEEGVLEATGIADEIKYTNQKPKVPFLKRIFK